MLHEAHSALATLIGPNLYTIGGVPPEQSVQFRDEPSFNLFLILLVEFFATGIRTAFIDDKYENWSLTEALSWFCSRHPGEARTAGLDLALSNLQTWVEEKVPFEFWCPEVSCQIKFSLSNHQLINFGANTAKHNLLRLTVLLGKLESLCTKAGYTFSPQELSGVLKSMTTEVQNRLMYHSTYLLELLGTVFFALNTIIRKRFDANPTNIVSEMNHPDGITSDIFRDLYGDVLVFNRYDEQRIRKYTPVTTKYLKLRY